MNEFVKIISKIGIFMIAGQAVIHFAPEQKYAKYMKLIVGLVILIQFLSPIYKLIGGSEEEWNAKLYGMAEELNAGLFSVDMATGDSYEGLIDGQDLGKDSLNAGIISSMEKEIKSKLNKEISGEGYSVIKVTIDVSTSGKSDISTKSYHNSYASNDNSSYEKYKLSKIRIAVRVLDDEGAMDNSKQNSDSIVRVDKVSIQKITTDKEGEQTDESAQTSDQKEYSDKQKISDRLRERFCTVLGIEEEYMEVSIYGAVE